MTIKFFLNPFYLTDNFSPEAVQLAYGFEKLGHTVIGNINYWPIENRFLIVENNQDNYDLAIMDHRFVYHTKPWVIRHHVDSSKLHSTPKVLLERQCGQELNPQWNRDGWLDFFDVICATDRTLLHPRHSKIVPWQIGIIPEARTFLQNNEMESNDAILYNFRVSHDVRGIAVKTLITSAFEGRTRRLVQHFDTDSNSQKSGIDLNRLTGGRFNEAYFRRVNSYSLFLTVGGYLQVKPFGYESQDAEGKVNVTFRTRLQRKMNRHFRAVFNLYGSRDCQFVLQWDSFRWWEGLCSSSVPVMLDFRYWGLELPVLPVEGEHYIGIKSLNDPSLLERISSMSEAELKAIGLAGRRWFEDHYSPESQAMRLLGIVEGRIPGLKVET
jgi:hypothetical protein